MFVVITWLISRQETGLAGLSRTGVWPGSGLSHNGVYPAPDRNEHLAAGQHTILVVDPGYPACYLLSVGAFP